MSTMENATPTTMSTPSDREFEMTRVFHAPRGLVWDAFTRPEHVKRWMLGPEGWTMPVCEIDLRPGGRWHFVWRRENGSEMEMNGEFREIDPPARLVQTERWGGDWPETVNTLTLTEEDGRTTMSQRMLFPSREARDAAMQTGMSEGADRSYGLLAQLLRSLA